MVEYTLQTPLLMKNSSNIEPIGSDQAKERLDEYQKEDSPDYAVGDFIKAELQTSATNPDAVEHVWFIITKINDGTRSFTGELNNHPIFQPSLHVLGDLIEVKYNQVSDYLPKDHTML
jgi:uncharacterized protein YegJ (DUF2314 family)